MTDDTVEWIDQTIGPDTTERKPPMADTIPPTSPVSPPDVWVQRIEAFKGLLVAILPYLVAIGGGAGWWHSAISNGGKLESVTSKLDSVTAKVDESAKLMTGRPPMLVGATPPTKQ